MYGFRGCTMLKSANCQIPQRAGSSSSRAGSKTNAHGSAFGPQRARKLPNCRAPQLPLIPRASPIMPLNRPVKLHELIIGASKGAIEPVVFLASRKGILSVARDDAAFARAAQRKQRARFPQDLTAPPGRAPSQIQQLRLLKARNSEETKRAIERNAKIAALQRELYPTADVISGSDSEIDSAPAAASAAKTTHHTLAARGERTVYVRRRKAPGVSRDALRAHETTSRLLLLAENNGPTNGNLSRASSSSSVARMRDLCSNARGRCIPALGPDPARGMRLEERLQIRQCMLSTVPVM